MGFFQLVLLGRTVRSALLQEHVVCGCALLAICADVEGWLLSTVRPFKLVHLVLHEKHRIYGPVDQNNSHRYCHCTSMVSTIQCVHVSACVCILAAILHDGYFQK